MKKSQVTIFIIIAVIVLILTTSIFLLNKDKTKENQINPETNEIYSYVVNCIKNSGEQSIEEFGNKSKIYFNKNQENSLLYSRKNFEKEISPLMVKNSEECLNKISSSFSDYEINKKNPSFTTKIEDNKIFFSLILPLTIKKQDKIYELREFNDIEVLIRLGIINRAIYEIIDEKKLHPNSICITCIGEIAEKYNLYIGLEYIDNSSIKFIIKDENSIINQKSYEFKFINEY